MTFFRYREDIAPVFCIIAVFAIDVAVFFSADSLVTVLAWSVLALFAKIFIAAWNHHHQHCPTFKQVWLNRLLEIVYTFHTGITTNVWVLHHNLGHHVHYLDQEKDESRWKNADGQRMGPFTYTMMTGLTGYSRAFAVGLRHRKFLRASIGMGTVNLLLLAILALYDPLRTTILFAVPMLLIYLGTCWTTYYHHSGLDADDHLHASHNIINRWYNLLSGNLGYHTAHHMKQALHWSKLPEFHKTIEAQIPAELISDQFPVIGGYYKKAAALLGTVCGLRLWRSPG